MKKKHPFFTMDIFDLDHYLENNAKALLRPLPADEPLSFEETLAKKPIEAPATKLKDMTRELEGAESAE